MHTTVINNNIDPGDLGPLQQYLNGPPTIILIQRARGPFNLYFDNQFKWAPKIIIGPGGPGSSI